MSKELRKTFRGIGKIVSLVDPYCGSILKDHSTDFCDSAAEIAKDYPQLARWLRASGKAAPFIGLLVGGLEIGAPILAHHTNLVNPLMLPIVFGVPVPPDKMTPQALIVKIAERMSEQAQTQATGNGEVESDERSPSQPEGDSV